MSEAAPGYGRRPDEPQCYNCGLMGHWAIGCPEPTRQTPAGLEAWRSAPNPGSGVRDSRGGQKKSKGPIITRYALPNLPAVDYSNRQTSHPTWNQPLPPHPSHSEYRQQPLPQPPPPMAAGPYSQYPPQSYQPPPGYYSSPGYSAYQPPTPHGYGPGPPPPVGRDYPPQHHSQQSLAPETSYPPTYPVYPSQLPPGISPTAPPPPPSRRLGPPPRPPPSHSPPGHRSYRYSPPPTSRNHRSPQRRSQPPQNVSRQRRPSGPSPPRPSIGMAKSDMIAHGLPPKPPPSSAHKIELRHESGNKKGQSKRPGNHDDNVKKQNQDIRRKGKKQKRRNRQRGKDQIQSQTPRPEHTSVEHQSSPPKPERPHENGEVDATPGKVDDEEIPLIDPLTKEDTEPPSQVCQPTETEGTSGELEPVVDSWEEEAIFKEPKPMHSPDEVGRPLPGDYTEDILLPRKWNAKCIESEYFDADSLENFIKPIHETKHWELLQYDPAFALNGTLPCGDALSSVLESILKAPQAEETESIEQPHSSPQQPRVEESVSSQDRHSKRRRSVDSITIERSARHEDSQLDNAQQPSPARRDRRSESRPGSSTQHYSPPRSFERRQSPSPHRHRPSRGFRRSRTPDRRQRSAEPDQTQSPDRRRRDPEPRRSRSPDRRQHSRSRSRRSSNSSAPSRSSSLNSLERELLGVASPGKEGKQPSDDERAHAETGKPPKPKRRRAQVDSAYSRRW